MFNDSSFFLPLSKILDSNFKASRFENKWNKFQRNFQWRLSLSASCWIILEETAQSQKLFCPPIPDPLLFLTGLDYPCRSVKGFYWPDEWHWPPWWEDDWPVCADCRPLWRLHVATLVRSLVQSALATFWMRIIVGTGSSRVIWSVWLHIRCSFDQAPL